MTGTTWADLENGRRLAGATCSCGRRIYDRRDDRIVRCDGCGEILAGCLCPPAKALDGMS